MINQKYLNDPDIQADESHSLENLVHYLEKTSLPLDVVENMRGFSLFAPQSAPTQVVGYEAVPDAVESVRGVAAL